jgi:hypothetical protein
VGHVWATHTLGRAHKGQRKRLNQQRGYRGVGSAVIVDGSTADLRLQHSVKRQLCLARLAKVLGAVRQVTVPHQVLYILDQLASTGHHANDEQQRENLAEKSAHCTEATTVVPGSPTGLFDRRWTHSKIRHNDPLAGHIVRSLPITHQKPYSPRQQVRQKDGGAKCTAW